MAKCKLKNVATARWDFAQLRKNGDCVYVDKTDMLAELAMRDPDVETKKGAWIFEFKFNRSVALAIRQIRDRSYADACVDAGPRPRRRPVTLVGIKFDPKIKNIVLPKFEQL